MNSRMPVGVRQLFLDTAHVVRNAVCDEAVGNAWDESSVLDEQTVGGIAGHLARGGVWVVGDYLDADLPDAPFMESAALYFARSADFLNANDHRDIRARGARVAAQGQTDVCATLEARLDALAARLPEEAEDRRVGVAAGVAVMVLDRYLETRIVEQVVHLDDLARSIDREPWAVPVDAQNLALHIGVDVGTLRSGATEMLRALYRSKLDPALPVI